MNKKAHYEAPEMVVVEVKLEGGIMNYSGGTGTASASKMSSQTWDNWDE